MSKLFLFFLASLQLCVIQSSNESENETCDKKSEKCDDGMEEGFIDWALNDLEQDDPKLIEILKERYLIPPPSKDKKLNLYGNASPSHLRGQFGQPFKVDEILK